MASSEPKGIAQKVDQVGACVDRFCDVAPIDFQVDYDGLGDDALHDR
jgi:hypothetical protein